MPTSEVNRHRALASRFWLVWPLYAALSTCPAFGADESEKDIDATWSPWRRKA